MNKHHPSQDQLSTFAAGSLSLHQAAIISAHMSYCPQCKADVKKLESLGGASLDSISNAEVSTNLKSKVMAALGQQQPEDKIESKQQQEHDPNLPSALRKLLPEGLDKVNWRWTGPGIYSHKLDSIANGSQLSLLKIEAGKPIAHHTHKGSELTLLLKGSLSDEYGVYQKGDYIHMDEQHQHRPVASFDEDCICLTVVEEPLHFTGFLMGMLNPVIANYLR